MAEGDVSLNKTAPIVLSEEAFQDLVAALLEEPEPPSKKLLAALADYKEHSSRLKTTG